jgi:hypothetical protein
MDVRVYPRPNPAITAAMMSPRMQQIVTEIAVKAQTLYVAQVAKRTGALSESAHALPEIGGVHHDRWIGVLTVGGATAAYAASHEFGVGNHAGSRHNLDAVADNTQPGAHDLNRVLEELGGL